jgi:hypothetical protein
MNSGFSNLDTLKKQLLAGTMKNDVRFDAIISALGLGVAGQFATFCNRKFQRVVSDTEILPADRCQFLLSCYPLETISAVDIKVTEALGFESQSPTTFYNTIDLKSGIVNCPEGADAGPWYAQVRFTYTGGYWWETLEPDDASFPSTMPAGAASLPSELFHAWILQCRHTWSKMDKLGVDLLSSSGGEAKVRFAGQISEAFMPEVKATLGQFTRYNLV